MSKSLVVDPICVRYDGPEGFEDLANYLRDSSVAKPLEIRRPEDILLSLDGVVQQAYRFTPFGLYTLCRRMSPNLGAVVSDIAGISGRPSCKYRTDPRTAVSVVNSIIRIRFDDALLGTRMIVDPVRLTIDGIVGARYEFLSNYELMDSCNKFVKKWNGEFLSGALVGRRMYLRYASLYEYDELGFEDGHCSYTMGWSFSNSETGQSAVKAGILLVDEDGNSSMKPVFHRKHTKGLRDASGEWLVKEMDRRSMAINWDAIAKGMDALYDESLPVCKDGIHAAKCCDKLTSELSKRICKQAARDISREMFTPNQVMVGSSSWRPPVSPIPDKPGGRSYYDLYKSMTSRASSYSPSDQESIEALAYDLLRGRMKPFEC
jgi:hypothetical protein